MGVYIKGMDMPKSCNDCALLYDCFACMLLGKDIDWGTSDKERLPDCPLVEVKEPHGRLIDADALIESNKYLRYNPAEHKEDSYDAGWAVGFNAGASHATEHAVYAPTIIEAEGKDNG